MSVPKTHYATSGEFHIAYQVLGEGPLDLVLVPGFATHVELAWESAEAARFMNRLASFARLIVFDKRGTGLSDPVDAVPTLEERIDDVRAVMDAAGSQRAALFGISEGAPMCILFAATHPERASALVLHGAMARTTEAPDYPWAAPADVLRRASDEFIAPTWGDGATTTEIFAPSLANDPRAIDFQARFERHAASPRMIRRIFEMFLDIDVRDVLPSIHVPTLVTHRRGDRVVNVRAGRWLAEHIEGAKFVELPGIDHIPASGDADAVLDEIEEFLTGVRRGAEPDRVLATVMFTDIVGSTQRATDLGDRRWRDVLESVHAAIRAELSRHRGNEVKTTGDGMLATFDGPARAIRCGVAIVDAVGPLGVETRVGLHAGEIEIMGEDVGGISVHIASRVGELAAPGQVLVSGTVKDLVAGSGISFADRGHHELKGIPEARQLFSVER